jgi:hypothetical protein
MAVLQREAGHDQIGLGRGDYLHRLAGVIRLAANRQIGLVLDKLRHPLANDGQIIQNQHPCFADLPCFRFTFERSRHVFVLSPTRKIR